MAAPVVVVVAHVLQQEEVAAVDPDPA